MKHINIDIPGNEYEVCAGRGLIGNIVTYLENTTSNRNVLIVTDDFFANKYAFELQQAFEKKDFFVHMYVMKGGKISKSFSEVLKIYGILEVNDFARDSTLVALGGGVIGDLAGFVASTWYRGMYLLHIPTTLMGMVDSSIGGKVAINFRQTINAVGNYYHPIANFTDIDFVDSLSARDYFSGLAEIIKCAIIADVNLIDYLIKNKEKVAVRNTGELIHCITRAIEIKVDHVKNDVKEGGKRLLLNYGHTLGHAIEMATQTSKGESFRHGESVSLGIVAVLSISQSHLNLSSKVIDAIRNLLEMYNLPIDFSASKYGFDRVELIDLCMQLIYKDKKRKDNDLRFILTKELGAAEVHTGISKKQIKKAFELVIKD
ncbi:MAG: 3-dehydroquinate synthase [Francisellaceae bacterium]|jgi:3-dehydroquinate synthase